MKENQIRTILLSSVLLSSAFFLVITQGSNGQEIDTIRLYPHLAGTLDTIPPTSGELRPEAFSQASQETKAYTLTYPLTRDLLITGGRNGSIILHLAASQTITITDDLELDVRLMAISSSDSEIQLAGGIFPGLDMGAEDLELSVTDPMGMEVSKGSLLELRISLIGEITLPSQTFTYNIYTPSDNSYLELGSNPIDEDIGVELTDVYGSPLEEILSNGPASSRTFNISISVRDAFGAYDVSGINILMASQEGNIIWNHTGEPSGNDGDTYAVLNVSHTINEGTPEGEYNIFITVSSNTGQKGSAQDEIIIGSGLYVSVEDVQKNAAAGETLEFTMTILNGGEGTDRVTFDHTSEKGWNAVVPDPVEIDGGATVDVIFRIFVPIRSSVGDSDTSTLSVISRNAEKTYLRSVSIYVNKAASFGVSPLGDTTTSILSGSGAPFAIEIINIKNRSSTFEIGIEDLPSSWSISYSGGDGSMQGSLFILDVQGEEEVIMNINIISDQGSHGVRDMRLFVRERGGGSETKYVYLRIRVVDPERNILTLLDTTDTKTSGRVGTGSPIRYSDVFFNLELYNPTLTESSMRIDVFGPADWELEYDYGSIDLLPGETSYWNISITPAEDEIYSDEPFGTNVEVSGITSAKIEQQLNIILPRITSVEVSPDKNSPDVMEGSWVVINLTFNNIGNHPLDVSVSSDQPHNTIVSIDPVEFSLDVGEWVKVMVTIEVNEVTEEGIIDVTVNFDFDAKSGSKEISVYAFKDDNASGRINIIWIVIGVVIAVLLIAGGYFVYTKVSGRNGGSGKPTETKGESDGVKSGSSKGSEDGKAGPAGSPMVSSRVKKADDLADRILSSSGNRKELQGGITVEAEPEVMTAEILE